MKQLGIRNMGQLGPIIGTWDIHVGTKYQSWLTVEHAGINEAVVN